MPSWRCWICQLPSTRSTKRCCFIVLTRRNGLRDVVLSWLNPCLDGRTQFVRCGSKKSKPSRVVCGEPQESVLGLILFLLYTTDLLRLMESHGLHPHVYADDNQIYGFCRPNYSAELQYRLSVCISDVASWMRSNRLQLNSTKTELLWCSSARRQHQIPNAPIAVGSDNTSSFNLESRHLS